MSKNFKDPFNSVIRVTNDYSKHSNINNGFWIKSNIFSKNLITDACAKILENFQPEEDSDIVRILSKDFTLLGNTNMDEFGMGSCTENEVFGKTLNPWNLDYAVGGSSGGTAVSLLQTGLFGLGSDTGGSVRSPAVFTKLLGYKPTRGIISRFGLISFSNSIESIGIMTKNEVNTILKILKIIQQNKTVIRDDTTVLISCNDVYDKDSKIKILIPTSEFLLKYCDPDMLSLFNKYLDILKHTNRNIRIIKSKLLTEYLWHTFNYYYKFSSLEAYTNLLRYDKTIFPVYNLNDHHINFSNFDKYRKKVRKEFGQNVKNRLKIAKQLNEQQRKNIILEYDFMVKNIKTLDFDFIFTPGSTKSFFMNRVSEYSDIFYPIANFGNLPAIVLHTNVNHQDLPLQIIGNTNRDWSLLKWIQKFIILSNINYDDWKK